MAGIVSPLLSRFAVLKPGPVDNTNGLIVWWTFDDIGTSGVSTRLIQDSSGNQNWGQLSSDVMTLASGVIGQALNSDGLSATLALTANVTAKSVAFWFNPSNMTNKTVLQRLDGNNTIQGDGSANWLIYDGSNHAFSSGPTLNSWHHYAFVYDGTKYNYYMDGVFQQAVATSLLTLAILGRTAPNNFGFVGLVDDIRIYNTQISASEVNALYNQGIAFANLYSEGEMPALLASAAAGKMLWNSDMSGLGSGGSFFHDRLAASPDR